MEYIIFPGRHLTHTRFQQEYLLKILAAKKSQTTVIFAVTSANQEDCRYNPIPFPIRVMSCDRFADNLHSAGHLYRIIGIPHYRQLEGTEICERILKHCEAEIAVTLNPRDAEIICSTPPLINAWSKLGFKVYECEATLPIKNRVYPVSIISELGDTSASWKMKPLVGQLAESSKSIFQKHPYLIDRIQQLWNDPLISEQGSICESRNYRSYELDMGANTYRKFEQLNSHITPGRISDEGCADGGLLMELAKTHAESDLIGIDISSEFAARFRERIRQGGFGGAYATFYHRNLMQPVFGDNSITTTLCNSTLHKLPRSKLAEF